jgi:HAD superfamily hydrolase (TIGR01509 family)
MAPPELVIFDCDGVLIDSERLAVRIEREMLAALGWKLTEREITERFVGRSTGAMLKAIEAHIGRPLEIEWKAELEARYRQSLVSELRTVDGVVDALERIDLPTCVASSSSHERLRFTLGLVGLYERFDGRIFSADDVANGKPAPDLFLHVARVMKALPTACVVIEDSGFGVRAAKSAGMRVLGYAGGLTPAGALAAEGATTFDAMRDLPAAIEAICA